MRSHKIILTHPTGNQNVRNALKGAVCKGYLDAFWTAIAWPGSNHVDIYIPQRARALLNRRSFRDVPKDLIHTTPWWEVIRLLLWPLPLRYKYSTEGMLSIHGVYDRFDAKVAKHLEKSAARAIYAYEGAALHSFRTAKKLCMKTIYEISSSDWYWNKKNAETYLDEDSKCSESNSLYDADIHLKKKDAELALSDYVVVPSMHVYRSMMNRLKNKNVYIVNYGSPLPTGEIHYFTQVKDALRVLCVGSVQERKGIKYLLDAIRLCSFRIKLVLVGRIETDSTQIRKECMRHEHYDSLPHEEVINKMRCADVLVNPSLSEGCSSVVLEALSVGLPVIVTSSCGVDDIVRNGQEGFVVRPASAADIAEKIEILHRSRNILQDMSKTAMDTAIKTSWNRYQQLWTDMIGHICTEEEGFGNAENE